MASSVLGLDQLRSVRDETLRLLKEVAQTKA